VTASSERPIEPAGEADLAALDALVEAAGWNQTTADWRLFLDHGRVWCIRDDAGRAVASAALLPYPPATGLDLDGPHPARGPRPGPWHEALRRSGGGG
jgi:hypothetical protein